MSVGTPERVEKAAMLNALLEQDIVATLFDRVSRRQSRVVAWLSATAVLLVCWNVFTLVHGLNP